MIAVLRTSIDVRVGALPWYKIHDWFFHNSVSDELLRAIGTWLQDSIPYWPYDIVTRIHDAPIHCNPVFSIFPLHLTEFDMLFFGVVFRLYASPLAIRIISLRFRCHSHTRIIQSLVVTVFEQIWIVINISIRHSFCSKFSNFGINFAAALFIAKTSVKIVWHEPNDMPTSSATSLIVIQWLSKFNQIYPNFLRFNLVIGCWLAGATRTSIVIDIFSAFFKPVIPQLNLCSAYIRIAKRRSQHFILYTRFNSVSLINIFE